MLRWSAPRAIVERSRKDRFWGVVPEADGVLRGENRLGRLLMALRQEVLERKATGQESHVLHVEPPQVPEFLLLGQAVGMVEAHTI